MHLGANPPVEAGVPPAWPAESQPTRLPLQGKQNARLIFCLYETRGDARFFR